VAVTEWSATLRFDVADTGIGIPADQQQNVFEVFTQVRHAENHNYGGTGLGLAICAKLVQMMGGKIWFESEPGVGTTFSFTAVFQRQSVGDPSRASLSPREAAQRALPLKILLAEDNSVNRQLAERFLKGAGHTVTSVADGAEAVRQVFLDDFDVVLMDVQMPSLDGFAATRLIRERERETGRHVPIVAMTAHAMFGDRDRCLEAGMDDYVPKPIKMKALLECLAKVAQKHPSSARPAGSASPAEPLSSTEGLLQLADGDAELLAEVIQAFLADAPQLLQDLRQAAAQGDPKQVASVAHTIKGVVSTFEATGCQQAAVRLERACEAGASEGVAELSALLEREIERLIETLRNARFPTA
jgi:CheY-like chemotaxis protein/HPt (histidine-containing phosphotransfer) domain-containing protein